MKRSAQSGVVYLVGAGPGNAELLTLRALRLIETADVILPDDLVSDEVLALASPTALVVPVGKRCGQPRITQAGIHALMLEHARAGRSVVRLKSGEPLIFGRAGEEIAALTEAAIPFEIVPGITAAFAVAAALKTPLTDRGSASKLIFATAHHAADRLQLTPKWEGAFPRDATLVVYMPGRQVPSASRRADRLGHRRRNAVHCRLQCDDERGTRAAHDAGGDHRRSSRPRAGTAAHRRCHPACEFCYLTSITGVTERPGRRT
jgi:uroporphyrin-III C-methyltransferase